MIKVPGERPFIPPITPKDSKKTEEAKPESQRSTVPTPSSGFAKGPEFDAQAIAVRMAAMVMEMKEKELSFDEIIQKVIEETGLSSPQAAMEEANRKLQKEIDEVLEEIKKNKDLMEEAESWQAFAEILEKELSEQQIEQFFGAIKESIKELKA